MEIISVLIDKLKVAKGEKQVYGTQGNYYKEYHFTLYPCTDPEHLNERREKVGLKKIDLKKPPEN